MKREALRKEQVDTKEMEGVTFKPDLTHTDQRKSKMLMNSLVHGPMQPLYSFREEVSYAD